MKSSSRRGKEPILVGLIIACLVYAALLHFHFRLTGVAQIDGIFGVLFGLYSASHPAGNILDLVIYGRHESVRAIYANKSRIFWPLNFLVLLASWVVISTSLLRYSYGR